MAKKRLSNYIFRPGISYNANLMPNAYKAITDNLDFLKKETTAYINSRIITDTAASLFPVAATLLGNNLDFIKVEAMAWIEYQKDNQLPGFVNYTYNQDKCERDMGYVIDAIYHDFRYGGNWKTRYISSFYWIDDIPQIDGDRQAEVYTYQFIRDLIVNYIFTGTVYTSLQQPADSTYVMQNTNITGPLEAGAVAKIQTLANIVADVIDNGLDSLPAIQLGSYPFANYTFNTAKCERDTGYVLEAYLYDIRYGGNEKLRYVASHYWDGDTAQVDGDRQPEIATHRWLADTIKTYILTQTAIPSPLQTAETQVIDGVSIGEDGSADIVENDVTSLLAVINNGLSSLPALIEAGYTKLKIQGRYTQDTLLLITNTTSNQVIYNFSTSTAGGEVTIESQEDGDFVKFLERSDGVTTIHLFADTTGSSASDDIQIFVEDQNLQVRPYDFGTDAIERMRFAPPLSMLDADFEYGLQPTKWQAIGIQRGYPSVYEIPGTDFDIDFMTTDASAPTDGVGASLISVETTGAHGMTVGTPVTVSGLLQGVSGVSRAEGAFVITEVPSIKHFKYYAKGKVGTTNGEVISATYTQIREGGFYTGASIGSPTFSLISNGVSGTATSVFRSPINSSRIAFTGDTPSLGAPITHPFLPEGTQVTGVVGSGGIVASPGLVGTYNAGDTQVTVNSTTGIVPNLGLDDGTGGLLTVSGIVGNVVTLSDELQGTLIGNVETYPGVSGTNIVGSGSEATFTVVRGALNTYVSVEIDSGGAGYEIGDTVRILGGAVGGVTPTNDIYITVTGVAEDSTNNITTFTYTGTAAVIPAQTIFAINSANWTTSGSGAGATFDVTRGTSTYETQINNPGDGFALNDTVTILGNIFDNGTTPDNDVTITVTEITKSYSNLPQSSTSGTGTNALWDVVKTGSSYTTVNQAPQADSTLGQGYAPNDTITILGSVLNGTDAVNDLTITVTETFNNYENVPQTSTTGTGTNAVFDISKYAATYNAPVVSAGGDGYVLGDTITIAGTSLGGATPANDLTFTVSGTTKTYTGLTQSSTTGTGSGAIFDVTKTNNVYTVLIPSGQGGINYLGGDEVRIIGTALDGATPANDLVITVDSIDGSGQILSFSIVGSANSRGTITQVDTPTGTAGGTGFIANYTFVGTAGGTGRISQVNTSGTANGSVTYLNVSGSSTASPGVGAVFAVTRNQGSYDNPSITFGQQGVNYSPGNRILIPGTALGGTSPTNDLIITIGSVGGSGEVVNATSDTNSVAFYGSNFDLYSTMLVSENLIDELLSGSSLAFEALATIEIQFATPHGILPGGNVIVAIESDDGTNNHSLASGAFSALNVPTTTSLRYAARAPGTIDAVGDEIRGTVYPRPDSFFVHRPFDGGVQLGTGSPQHGAQAIRQSKKYIRYQSGKGIMYTTGALFAPSYDILLLEADGIEVGSSIFVTLGDNDHGLQPGCQIRIIGAETSGYNGDYFVDDVLTERKFSVIATRRLGSKIATLSPECQVSTQHWDGAIVRAGIFDDQNGIFWEYNGKELAVVQRSATKQIAGTISCKPDSNTVTGTNTRFRDQLKAGDSVVIKGMTHVITSVEDQTTLYIAPDFRGVSDVNGAKLSLVFDKRTPQRNFNIDKLDGTGASGYDVDITKMQMIGIQYSWYGAGFIDFMLRGSDGNFVFCHRMRNSNVNTEAFMRSGNLPVRYEVSNYGPVSKLASNIDEFTGTVVLEDASDFPESGVIIIDNEIIRYNDKVDNTLLDCTRGSTWELFAQGADRIYSAGVPVAHTKRTGVISLKHTTTPLISHWGSAFITDGGFDEDRGYIFSYTEGGITLSTTKQTAFLLRLAPSVSNALTGDLGERELLNRAQLLLQGIEITSDGFSGTTPIQGGIVIEGIINPKNYPTDVGSVVWQGLSSQAQGGQPSFAQVAAGGGIDWTGGSTLSTQAVTYQGNLSTSMNNAWFIDAQGGTRDNFVYLFTTDVESLGLRVGMTCSTVPFNGRRITGITRIDATYTLINFNNSASNEGRTYSPGDVNLNFTYNTSRSSSPQAFVTKASWDSSGLTTGALIDVSDTNWPANTSLSSVNLDQIGGTQFYELRFNNSSTTTLSGGASIVFQIGEPPYAQPGETIFSFIAQPGESAKLDLNQLKELTNTTLGGRGTFPNGPDVLAINVYKTSGSTTTGNIILRWGEAQA